MRFLNRLNLPFVSGKPTGGDNHDVLASNNGNLYYRNHNGYWVPLAFDGFAQAWARNFIPNPSSSNKPLTPALGGLTTQTLSANICYFIPIWIPMPISLTHLGIQVSTAASSATAEAAIYMADGTFGRPGTRIAHVTGIDVATTGDKIIALASAVTIEPDMYWGAVRSNGAPTLRRFANMMPLTIAATTIGLSLTNTDAGLNNPPTDPTSFSTVGFNLLGRWTTP